MKPTFEQLRFQATTSLLKRFANLEGIDYSDIPEGASFKRKLAERLAEHWGIKRY